VRAELSLDQWKWASEGFPPLAHLVPGLAGSTPDRRKLGDATGDTPKGPRMKFALSSFFATLTRGQYRAMTGVGSSA
jgi:hypothetical protein